MIKQQQQNSICQKKSQVQGDFPWRKIDVGLKKKHRLDGRPEGMGEIQGSSRKGYTIPLGVGEKLYKKADDKEQGMADTRE